MVFLVSVGFGHAIHLQSDAEIIGAKLLESMNYIGVLVIEFFVKADQLLANEMAPRVHNSVIGRLRIESKSVPSSC